MEVDATVGLFDLMFLVAVIVLIVGTIRAVWPGRWPETVRSFRVRSGAAMATALLGAYFHPNGGNWFDVGCVLLLAWVASDAYRDSILLAAAQDRLDEELAEHG